MNSRDAVALIGGAVPAASGGVWADFGAGDGTFTRALAELLGPEARIFAVDRDAATLASISPDRTITTVVADFTRDIDLLRLGGERLDGALFANALHFVPNARDVLARLTTLVKSGGRVVFVEYDRRGPSPWVPFPIPSSQLPQIAAAAGLSTPVITATRRSAYGGELYVAAADRIATHTMV